MDFLQDLNTSQREAVEAIVGPVMVVAGAGSGKTRVLTYRIAHLIAKGVPPASILALTFTNKAADEMKERIVKLLKSDRPVPWMGTFHSVFARILRFEAVHLGFERSYSIYDSDDSLALVRRVMSELNISQQQFNPKAIRSAISSAKNRLMTPEIIRTQSRSPYDEKTFLVYENYNRLLKENNAMDFDDLITLPITLFESYADALARWQSRFSHILVDEYQDTNHAQYRLLKLFSHKNRNICVVGDDAQSIYAFRGADIRNILDFETDYPECRVFRLEQNYRSTKSILSAADSVIRNNVQRIPKTLWTENPSGEPVRVIPCADEREEGYRIAKTIVEEAHKDKRDFNQFAVLYRTNAQSRSIEDGLRRAGLPYAIVGGVEFYKRKEIKDAIAYLRTVVNPADSESLVRSLSFPPRGIGDTTLHRLRDIAREQRITLFDTFAAIDSLPRVSAQARRNVLLFTGTIRKYRGLLAEMSAGELSRSFIEEIGILKLYKEEGTPEALARWENVQELLSAVTEYCEDHPGAGLAEYLESVSLISDVDKWNDERNLVTLMTLHSAKGLEFPVVFIAGMEDGLFPMLNGSHADGNVEEERRLCYVGMTRARDRLFLTYARYRHKFGEGSYPMPSRFIDEIDPRFTRFHENGFHHRPDRLHTSGFPAGAQRKSGSQTSDRKTHYAYEDESQLAPELRVGSVVEHETFGRGKIIAVSGKGDMMKAVVRFGSVGQKSLMLKFARLKLLS